jgi:hypothetical protein
VKRTSILLAALVACATPALAETNIGISVNIGDAPPPPVVVVREEPRTVYLRDEHVYVVQDDRWDDDCFRVGAFWYSWHSGYWYRARTWRGPFRVIEERYVPVAIHRVPDRCWKHGHRYHGRSDDLARGERSRRHGRHRDREVVLVKERGRYRH